MVLSEDVMLLVKKNVLLFLFAKRGGKINVGAQESKHERCANVICEIYMSLQRHGICQSVVQQDKGHDAV